MGTDVAHGPRAENRAESSILRVQPAPAGDVVFVTNRGPLEHRFGPGGVPQAQRGAGGVVSGLLCAAEGRRVTWVSLAMTDADRAVAQRPAWPGEAPAAGLERVASKLVDVAPAVFHAHYDGFSNRMLWFLQHGLEEALERDPERVWAWWGGGYLPANTAVAEAVACEPAVAAGHAPVVFHDYHLYLAPALVRRRLPHARLAHFIHIPWPEPQAWERLPLPMVRRIFEGLLANDVVGFQTERDARRFLDGVAVYFPGARPVGEPDVLRWQGRRVRIGVYPIALTPETVLATAAKPAANTAARRLMREIGVERGRKLILRVDRVEPTKNIVRGFEAYGRLLREHPEWRGAVVFLALLVPSRESLPIYRACAARVEEIIRRVNEEFGTPDWTPIIALRGNDHARALASMRHYDVLLVNPLVDGMNLVAKEGAILNERDGVIVLSREAGTYDQLYGGVLGINPRDTADTAAALHEALSLMPWERARLRGSQLDVVWGESARLWLDDQLGDLETLAPPPAVGARRAYLRPKPSVVRDAVEALECGLEGLPAEPRPSPRATVPLA